MFPRMRTIDWTLLRQSDFIALGNSNALAPYINAASAQLVYFPENTIVEAARLGSAIQAAKIDERSTSLEVKNPLESLLKLGRFPYKLIQNQHVWTVEHIQEFNQGSPFGTNDWFLVFQSEAKLIDFSITSVEVLNVLGMLPYMNGMHSIEQISRATRSCNAARATLMAMVEEDLVSLGDEVSFDLSALPELLFLGHSGLAVRDCNDVLVIDPVALVGNSETGETERNLFAICNGANAILISHNHWDHLHFQTLARVRRDQRIIVPAATSLSYFNPSIKAYLQDIGFSNVVELEPWDEIMVGGIRLRGSGFHGECFGMGSQFDALTYYVNFSGKTLFGSVDACHDEDGNMEATIDRIAEYGALDFFCFGSSGQHHERPWMAGSPHHFSNELNFRRELINYHPTMDDVARWTQRLRPKWLFPYAEFLFRGRSSPDVYLSNVNDGNSIGIYEMQNLLRGSDKENWFDSVKDLARQYGKQLMMLQPLQGVRWGSAESGPRESI
jgi:L-ascorbate metabolism protein UlaG (beta-lactamase superfamily)